MYFFDFFRYCWVVFLYLLIYFIKSTEYLSCMRCLLALEENRGFLCYERFELAIGIVGV